jgi:hypothetical protein
VPLAAADGPAKPFVAGSTSIGSTARRRSRPERRLASAQLALLIVAAL